MRSVDRSYLGLIILNADGALTDESSGPEAIERDNIGRSGMGNQQHEAEDWLSQKIKDTIGVDLSIDAELAVSVTEDPDNWVKSPQNQGEGGKSDKELAGRRGASSGSLASTVADFVDEDDVTDPGNDVVSPLLELVVVLGKASKHASQHHDEVGENDDGNVVAVEASEEGKVEKEEWSGDGPIDVASP